MTLRQLIYNTVFPRLLKDTRSHRLNASACNVYLSLWYFPMEPVSEHAKRLGWVKSTIQRAISDLVERKWVYIAPERGPYQSDLFVASMPPEVESEIAKQLSDIRHEVQYVGEWLMKCILDLIVTDYDVWDNARPPWLVTQTGSGRLEFDRWYRSAGVAIEFQGPQHFRTITDFGSTDSDVSQQIVRDNIKIGICRRHNISLIEISGVELSPYIIRSKVQHVLPVAPLKESGPLFSTLSKMCGSYVNTIKRSENRAVKLLQETESSP